MTDTTTVQPTRTGSSRGLPARIFGVFTAPRETYAGLAAHPRSIAALATLVVIVAAATFGFLSTEVGRNAALDQQLTVMESFGIQPNAEQLAQIEQRSAMAPYFAVASQIVVIPLTVAVMAALGLAVFSAGFGGDGTFKQLYAIVTHASFITALGTLFVLPLNYARESMSSGTNLAVFLPMLSETSFFGRFLGMVDLFRIWWLVSVAIGFGVLYKRKTGPIAVALLAIYVGIALVAAGVMTALSGA